MTKGSKIGHFKQPELDSIYAGLTLAGDLGECM